MIRLRLQLPFGSPLPVPTLGGDPPGVTIISTRRFPRDEEGYAPRDHVGVELELELDENSVIGREILQRLGIEG